MWNRTCTFEHHLDEDAQLFPFKGPHGRTFHCLHATRCIDFMNICHRREHWWHVWKRVNRIFEINYNACIEHMLYVQNRGCHMLQIMWYFKFNYFELIQFYSKRLSRSELPFSVLACCITLTFFGIVEILYVHCRFFLLCIRGRAWKCIDGCGGETSKSDFLHDLAVYERIIWKWILKQQDVRAWTWFVWLSTGISGELLWPWHWTLRFHKIRILRQCEQPIASQEGPYFIFD